MSTVGIAIDTNLASRTGAGNLAAMGFATSLVQFPLGLIAAGVSSAVLPTLSRHAQRMADAAAATSAPETQGLFGASAALPERVSGGPLMPGAPPPGIGATLQDVPQAAYKEALALGLKLVFTAIVPATLGLLVLRGPIVRVLFQRGAFGTAAAQRTTTAFLAYSPGLPAAALDQLLIFGFYARKQTLPPVLVGIMGVGVYLTVGLALLGPLGMPGLALANSAQWVVHMLVMGVLTHRALGGLGGLGLPGTALRVLAATGAMTALLLLATILAPPQILEGAGALGAYLTILMAGGALAYLAVLRLVGPEELRLLTSAVRRRVGSDE